MGNLQFTDAKMFSGIHWAALRDLKMYLVVYPFERDPVSEYVALQHMLHALHRVMLSTTSLSDLSLHMMSVLHWLRSKRIKKTELITETYTPMTTAISIKELQDRPTVGLEDITNLSRHLCSDHVRWPRW